MLAPEQSNRVLSCLADPTDLSGLVDNQRITAPSLRFRIDNAALALGHWACEADCFSPNEQPDLNEGLGTLEIKPETIRFQVCSTRDVTEDAGFDFFTWLTNKLATGMRATINQALIIGDGVGNPLGR